MTTMIERVARALCVAAGHDPDRTHDIYVEGDPDAGVAWAGYRREARAAIEAMREPTEAMVDAACDVVVGFSGEYDDYNVYLGSHEFNGVWTAAIDAALKESA